MRNKFIPTTTPRNVGVLPKNHFLSTINVYQAPGGCIVHAYQQQMGQLTNIASKKITIASNKFSPIATTQ